ncbi:MAG: hypothetical protein Q8862_05075, partial [Bacteroidota bacterium]|nr:hypothetical protein [Bacteroidota bacterium]
MKIDKYYTLRTKITVLALIVSFTITIIGFAIVYMQNTMIFKKNLSEKISFQAKIISEYCTVPLVFDDQAGATEVLNRLRV